MKDLFRVQKVRTVLVGLALFVVIAVILALNGTRLAATQDQDAEFHFKVALVALKNNDLPVAARELQAAAKLAPQNALILYNLAVVESKQGDPVTAMEHLRRAMAVGLPATERAAADDLLVTLSYESTKTGSLAAFRGTWNSREDKRRDYTSRGDHCIVAERFVRTVTFEPPTGNSEVTAIYTEQYNWNFSTPPSNSWCWLSLGQQGARLSKRRISLSYDRASRLYVGKASLIACEGPGCDRESSEDFNAEPGGTTMTFSYYPITDGVRVVFTRY